MPEPRSSRTRVAVSLMGEQELAIAMAAHVLDRWNPEHGAARP